MLPERQRNLGDRRALLRSLWPGAIQRDRWIPSGIHPGGVFEHTPHRMAGYRRRGPVDAGRGPGQIRKRLSDGPENTALLKSR